MTEYSAFLKHLGIDKKQIIASMWSKIPDSEKPSKRGREMTKEELEKEAIAKYKTGSYPQLHPDIYAFIHGYLAGAESREKRIKELEAQIEKMKCCGNCKHYKPVVTINESISNMCEDYYDGCNNNIYEPYNKWELKEK